MTESLMVMISLIANLVFGKPLPFQTKTAITRPDLITEKVAGMSLEEKVRQTLICGYDSKILDSAFQVLKYCGNLIYGKSNPGDISPETISQNNLAIHQKDPNVWIFVDQEGGEVSRIKDGSPSPRKMAEDRQSSHWGQKHGELLRSLGFDVNLAPVVDVTSNNSAIRNRSFADDPNLIGKNAIEYLEALRSQGIHGVIKHLPGHGRVDTDTHNKAGTLNYSWEEIKNFDLVPFVDSIKDSGVRLVMIGHIIVPEIDQVPASLSQKVLEKFRSELPHGKELIFLTDSLQMNGVGLPQEAAAIEALKAGEDMIIVEGIDTTSLFDKIVTAYKEVTLDESKLDQSVYRILKTKQLNN